MQVKKFVENLNFENCRIVCRNFAGVQTDFNKAGDRNFGVLIDDEMVPRLQEEGWKIKFFKARPDDPTQHQQAWLKVNVKFGKVPPIANLISSRGRTRLDANTIGQLDFCRIKNVDLVVRPYCYPASNIAPAGISAYLKAIYVTIDEDNFAAKYADIPEN